MSKVKKIFTKRFLFLFSSCFKFIIAKILCIFSKKNEDIWIICERRNEARDNGYHLFKYIIENYKEQKVFYAIDLKSSDVTKLYSLSDNVIKFGSIKHWKYFLTSSALISTHIDGYVPNEDLYKLLSKKIKLKSKKIFLQHGIIKDNLPQLYYEKTKLDMFVCGAKPEYEYVKNNFNYPNGIVKYLGLCRYDNLFENQLENIILVMPTFRMQFYIPVGENISGEMYDKFINSEYYQIFYKLINDTCLNNKLKEKKYKLVFYPHHEMQKYLKYFKTELSNIYIANPKEDDIQQYLKISKLLVTDYSSVFFDFAFMKKKILFYQFDYNEYRKNHYGKGYFNYEDQLLGNVYYNYEKLIDEIYYSLNNDCKVKPKILNNIEEFFEINDKNNCKRNYESIRSLVK